jgi:predicted nucleic-acid-binding protein
MKHIIIDTNGFLRFILNDVPTQKKIVEKLLQEAKQNKILIFVPQIVIFEIEFTLSKYYGFSKEDIIEKLKIIASASYLDIQDREIVQTALKLYKDEAVSFVDCFLYAKSKTEKIELFTFDKKLQNL